MEEFLVTIGIPVYNEEEFIEETLLSSINQSYKGIKIIVSDNASTDKTYDIISRISEGNSNIEIYKQKENIGVSENFNFLAKQAKTKYFCWLGGHDILHKDFVLTLLNIIEKDNTLSLVYPNSMLINKDGSSMNIYQTSDISTIGLNEIEVIEKVIRKLYFCTPIHGLFPLKVVQNYLLKNIVGCDNVFLLHVALFGNIFFHKETLFYLREVRIETELQSLIRYNDYGMYGTIDNPNDKMIKEYFQYILHIKKNNIFRKFRLLVNVSYHLKIRYNSPYFSLLAKGYWYYNKLKNLTK